MNSVGIMRKRKDFYFQKYDRAVELHKTGKSIQNIAKELDLSYSAVYSWLNNGKRPEKDALNYFVDFLRKNGPMPAIFVKELFPSHDDLFHMAVKRGSELNRHLVKGRSVLKQSGVWYYIDGQEDELKKRVIGMLKKYNELKSFILQKKAL
ncbi:MAG: helix-turn-helix domain-containing protein [Candidatus Aenigmarchaeota archaeon]|nr:helix-turn-helix domain-containing protein [Candidatus Aenigmarchaeota archaeon]